MDNKIALGVISVFVVLAVIGSALTPMIDAYTTTTITTENEGAVGLRMEKVTSGDFTLNYGLVGDDFTATNGTDTQIIDDMCIFYADDNVAVWMDDSSVRMLGKDANDQTIDAALSDEATITITKSADGVNVTDGTIDQTFPVPAWSYVPKSTGAYGFFLNETEVNTGGLDVHYVGSFAGVNCYDSIIGYDLPLALDATVTDSKLTGAKWIKAADPETEITPLEPGSLTPLDPGVISIDPEPDVSIMSVPTPTYTEGDWGYDLITSGEFNGMAKIVSYSGDGVGPLTIPATIGGYDVATVGKGFGNNVIDTSLSVTGGLIISEGIKTIATDAFVGCTNITGNLVLPSTLTQLGQSAFSACHGFTGRLVLPDNLTTIGQFAFNGCDGFTGSLIIPESVTTINNSLRYMTGLSGVVFMGSPVLANITFSNTTVEEYLNFGDTVLSNGTNGISNTAVIRQGDNANIPALGYLAPTQVKETVTDDSPMAALLHVIPLITIIAVVMMAVGVFIAHRTE